MSEDKQFAFWSPEELQVVRDMWEAGANEQQIADTLKRSWASVYRKRLRMKLGGTATRLPPGFFKKE